MSAPPPAVPWRATVLTLFPDMFPGPLGQSLAGRALHEGRWSLDTIDMRDFATDAHHTVDDTPFGGGHGMVLRPDIVAAAIAAARRAAADRPLICLSARGRPLDQAAVRRLSAGPGVILVCGRFEGIDQRALEATGADEVAIGDYVLSGGEPAAFVVLDACVRLLPGVVGAPESLAEESHADGLLEYPQYTRPQEWCGRRVPEVLLSGHHGRIRAWRLAAAEETTRARRPDLWARYLERRRATPGDA